MGANLEQRNRAEQHHHGQGGDDRGKKDIAQRIVVLQPGHGGIDRRGGKGEGGRQGKAKISFTATRTTTRQNPPSHRAASHRAAPGPSTAARAAAAPPRSVIPAPATPSCPPTASQIASPETHPPGRGPTAFSHPSTSRRWACAPRRCGWPRSPVRPRPVPPV